MTVPLRAVIVVACALAGTDAARAQQALPSWFAVDSVAALEQSIDENGASSTGITIDSVVSVDLGGGFEAFARPFVQRLPNGEWNRQVWVAAVRYERPGPVSVRLDAGLIPSPVGLANLMLRPHQNPTISLPSSLFVRLPALAPGAPRTTLLGVTYPYGANVTVSTGRWDARAAVIDTSPLRTRRVFGRANPPRFANLVAGGGVTPIVGLRIGASLTHGGWRAAHELPGDSGDRTATIATIEAEYAVAYTKISGEWVRNGIGTEAGDRVASGWFVQGQQTVTPRWFAAARVERITAPPLAADGTLAQRFTGVEETIGYRVTPEITIRAGHRARRSFGRGDFDHQAAVSVVWWKRWW